MNQDTVYDSGTSRVPTIAIVGMEGSGKTVLITALAKWLSSADSSGLFLNPRGVKTLKYVEHVWSTLQSGQWPPSTPPGELFELKWTLQDSADLKCDVRVIDAAGQDLRLLFETEQILESGELPGSLQTLAEYCRSADILLFVINLGDFVGEGSSERRTANEAAIKSAMDYLRSGGRHQRACLILTQADLYRAYADQNGGWMRVLESKAPYVFGAHVWNGQVPLFPVSAVAHTRVVADQSGSARRVPATGFQSEGFYALLAWLTGQIRELDRELAASVAAAARPEPSTPWSSTPSPEPERSQSLAVPAAAREAESTPSSPSDWVINSAMGALFVFAAFFVSQFVIRTLAPVSFTAWVRWGSWYDDILVRNDSGFELTNVKLTAVNAQGKWLAERTWPKLAPGQTGEAISVMTVNRNTAVGFILTCDQGWFTRSQEPRNFK